MICDNADASREELSFEQPYYALRFLSGTAGWKQLKVQAIAMDAQLRQICNIPQPGNIDQPFPTNADACYIQETEKNRHTFLAELNGDAAQEASRDVEKNIALQQKLMKLGFLPTGTAADGIFGEGTRSAIITWQRVGHRPLSDGFISNIDAAALMSSDKPASNETAIVDSPARADTAWATDGPTHGAPAAPAPDPVPPAAAPVATSDDGPAHSISVEVAIANHEVLVGNLVKVQGVLECVDEICYITQSGGNSSIRFDDSKFDADIRVSLLKCGRSEITCTGWLMGALRHDDTLGWTTIDPQRIDIESMSAVGE